MEEQNDSNGGHRDQRIRMDYLEKEFFFLAKRLSSNNRCVSTSTDSREPLSDSHNTDRSESLIDEIICRDR